ncbi:hypothetical protein ACIO6T_31095 [Streptomyces sp. NPDC087532]|uniref:hypothetical protein n=1 Tax=Streptomyces sp. NPDC087532 TaxID=3365795 RepID=UPI003803B9B8
MRTLVLADHPGPLVLPDRPTTDDYPPLPHGLTLDDAVARRAHQVGPGDLLLAEFTDATGTGPRPAEHIPDPYPAAPHPLSACPCTGCEACNAMDSWTLADHSRTADIGWRYVCLAPAEDGEPCTIVLRNRPMAVIPAGTVARARAQYPTRPATVAADAPGTPHTVPAAEFTRALHAWNTGHPHAIPAEASDTTPVPVTVAGTTVDVHPGLLRMLTALITDQQSALTHPEGHCPHCAGTGSAADATGPDPADFDSYEGSDGLIYHGFGEPDIEATAEAATQAHTPQDDQ